MSDNCCSYREVGCVSSCTCTIYTFPSTNPTNFQPFTQINANRTKDNAYSTLLRWADELRDITVLVSSTNAQDLILSGELGADGAGLLSISQIVEQPALSTPLLAVRSAQTTEDCELALTLFGPKLKDALQVRGSIIGMYLPLSPLPIPSH